MTSIVSLSTPLPKNKNNIPSFSSSPTAIKISDGSPCQIIRKDDICYLIKADNGKEEFVFEDEIKIIESPSQSSNLQSLMLGLAMKSLSFVILNTQICFLIHIPNII